MPQSTRLAAIIALSFFVTASAPVAGQTSTTLPTTQPATQPGWQPAPVDPNAPPQEIIRTKWEAVVDVLQNKAISERTKGKRIETIVRPLFDFPLMSRLALGRTHWGRMSPAQRQRYVQLFTEHLKQSYRGKIGLYKGEEIRGPARLTGEAAQAGQPEPRRVAQVPVKLVSSERNILVIHKLRKTDSGWMIYDVEIEGVSVVMSYRAQFRDILRDGDIETLLARLAERPRR